MRVLIIVAQKYNGHELWTTLGILQAAEIEFEVVSTETLIVDEVTGQPNTIERTLDDIFPDELPKFEGLMIISGDMKKTEAYWKDDRVLSLVRTADELELPIAAICCSVPTIREVTAGVKVSPFPLVRSRVLLEEAGAILQTKSITVDGRIVTAENQMGTQVWAEQFVRVLQGLPSDLDLKDSGFMPTGKSERALPHILERIRGTDISYRTKDKK
jgi:putative intracellular protease/amidase